MIHAPLRRWTDRIEHGADLELLGQGVDAIVQRDVASMPLSITPEMRLRRYARARALFPDRMETLRRLLGQQYKRAWASGVLLNLASAHRAAECAVLALRSR